MNMSASSIKYAIASILIVVLTLLIDYIFFQNEALIESTPQNARQVQINPPQNIAKPLPTMTQLSLVNITLPRPLSTQKAKYTKLTPDRELIPIESKVVSENHKVDLVNRTQPQLIENNNENASKAVTSDKSQIKQRLNQLLALEGINRTLYFPESNTPQILAYMHNCVGIDVGGVQQNNLILFSHKNSSHSEIVRQANGYKTPHEQALLAAYAPNQTLVRLYPKWFDERLGKEIAASLGNQTLQQLSGHYTLRGNTLWLTNIELNHQFTQKEWLLSQGC